MRIVVILALPLLIAATHAPRPAASAAAKPVCQNSGVLNASDPKPSASVHKLGDEPPARQVLTVVRTIDGCSRPVVVREDIGPPVTYRSTYRSSTRRP